MHLAGHCYEIKKQLRINRTSTKLALEDVSEKIAYFFVMAKTFRNKRENIFHADYFLSTISTRVL